MNMVRATRTKRTSACPNWPKLRQDRRTEVILDVVATANRLVTIFRHSKPLSVICNAGPQRNGSFTVQACSIIILYFDPEFGSKPPGFSAPEPKLR
ncbi:uncharacterized protein METZ01_LOCUS283840, partial [marine metagenome]